MANSTGLREAVDRVLDGLGYAPDRSMAALIPKWWGWYTARDRWYTYTRYALGHPFRIRRKATHPAKQVCVEWASAILSDDGTTITVESLGGSGAPDGADGVVEVGGEPTGDGRALDDATGWLVDWCARNRFVHKAQMTLERAFALGTGAMALWFDRRADGSLTVRPRRYDARAVLPLTWDDDEVSECAFLTSAQVGKLRVNQLQCHVLVDGGYHIRTYLFDAKTNDPVEVEGVVDDYATGVDRPTFCILRPALDNTFADGTAMGQSVYADAIDVLKAVDDAFDSLQDEIDTTKIKLFMSDDLIDMVDDHGRPVPVPMSPENLVIRKVAGNGGEQMLETFQPKIRVGELDTALNIALAELGTSCGFGPNYLRYDKDAGLKTATEVSSDNSAFARNLRKHECEIQPQLEGLLGCLVDCVTGSRGAQVNVRFDDSIINDTNTAKTQMLAEIGAGVMAPYEYRMKFLGESEEVARAAIAEINGAGAADLELLGTLE